MTIKEKNEYKRAAKEAMIQNGYKVNMKDMVLLETGAGMGTPSYVMFKDRKSGKEFQCWYGARYYNPDTGSLWAVSEYTA